jgi:hypothetical protein
LYSSLDRITVASNQRVIFFLVWNLKLLLFTHLGHRF